MKEIPRKFCAYCGEELPKKKKAGDGENTGDHVPPKKWFTDAERARTQMITVPACLVCNQEAKQDDEISKHVANLVAAQMQNTTADQIQLHKKTLRGNNKLNKSILYTVPIMAEDSLLDGNTLSSIVSFEHEINVPEKYIASTKSVFQRIARGLYWRQYNERIICSKYQVNFIAGLNLSKKITEKRKDLKACLDLMNVCQRVDVLQDVFTYWIARAEDEKHSMICIMCYRRSLLVSVIAHP